MSGKGSSSSSGSKIMSGKGSSSGSGSKIMSGKCSSSGSGSGSGSGSSSGSVSKVPKRPKPTCLIVHGDAMAGRLYERLLERFNLETLSVTSGREALDIFLSGKPIDMVFMDQQLSDMDGKEATKALLKAGVKAIIVGLHESDTTPEEIKASMEAGIDCSIGKPLTDYKVKELYEKLGVEVEFVVKK